MLDPQIDLAHREAGRLQAEIEVNRSEFPKPLPKQSVVPSSKLGKPIVGNRVCRGLLGGQVLNPDHRHLCAPQHLQRKHPAMTGQDPVIAVDQDRSIETKGFDAPRDLPNLPRCMLFGIVGIVAKVRFGVILHPHRRIGHILGGIGTELLAGRRMAAASRHAAVHIALVGRKHAEIGELGRVAAHPLRGRRYIAHAMGSIAAGERSGRLPALWRGSRIARHGRRGPAGNGCR